MRPVRDCDERCDRLEDDVADVILVRLRLLTGSEHGRLARWLCPAAAAAAAAASCSSFTVDNITQLFLLNVAQTPERFFSYLTDEQKWSKRLITINRPICCKITAKTILICLLTSGQSNLT